MIAPVKNRRDLVLPIVLMLVFAATRWPGLMPPNFSAAYGLLFCAGVYFPGRMAWWLPLAAMAVTDLAINVYYTFAQGIPAFQVYQLVNYVVYIGLIGLGRLFSPKSNFLNLLAGGIAGAILFYIITNTASWLFNPFQNPEYTRDFSGWLIALTKGVSGWPATWEFFRNSLLSGALFTGLFAGAMKLSETAEEAEEETAGSEEPETEPEEAKA